MVTRDRRMADHNEGGCRMVLLQARQRRAPGVVDGGSLTDVDHLDIIVSS